MNRCDGLSCTHSNDGSRRLLGRRTHIGPDHAANLDAGIGLELDLLAEAARRRLRRHVDALARSRRISSRDRGSAGRSPRCGRTRAKRRDGRRTRPSGRGGPGVSRNAISRSRQQLHLHRRAVRPRQFLRHQGRNPVPPEQFAHRSSRACARQELVLFMRDHAESSEFLLAPQARHGAVPRAYSIAACKAREGAPPPPKTNGPPPCPLKRSSR